MGRNNGRRYGVMPVPAVQRGLSTPRICLGCPAQVSAVRLCCPRCWGCLDPDLQKPLRDTTAPPESALEAARAWLARGAMARAGLGGERA